MDMNLATTNPLVLLRDVSSHVGICFPIRPVMVHT